MSAVHDEVRGAIDAAAHVLINDPNHDDVTERLMLARVEVAKRLSDSELLQMAQTAWYRSQRALRDMQRLNRYANKSAGMKDDYNRAAGIYRHNTELHEKIMRGQL